MPLRRKSLGEDVLRRRQRAKQAHRFPALAAKLADIAKNFYIRGWALGTSGNFSAVVSENPFRLAITPTGMDKGALSARHILEIDDAAKVIRGPGKPSSESKIHLAIANVRGAGAVLHTHSVWSTIISEACAPDGGVAFEGYEMLKGLEGVRTHQHREWLPILENFQDAELEAQLAESALKQHPAAHGFLLRKHGLYTWGQRLADAKRHVEILEFLLEVVGRTRATGC